MLGEIVMLAMLVVLIVCFVLSWIGGFGLFQEEVACSGFEYRLFNSNYWNICWDSIFYFPIFSLQVKKNVV